MNVGKKAYFVILLLTVALAGGVGYVCWDRKPLPDDEELVRKAKDGDPYFQCQVGACYENGLKGVEVDPAEAIKWYQKAAKQGSPYGICYLAWIREERYPSETKEMHIQAYKGFRELAKKGDSHSYFFIGVNYELGLGTERNLNEALKWYRKGAEAGMTSAERCLGLCCVYGIGTAQDYDEAEKWLQRAAKKGDPAALYGLGVICEERGDTLVGAIKWYKQAAEQGFAKAQYRLALMYDAKGDYEEAVTWTRKAARNGYPSAQNNMGYYYENGIGVEKSMYDAKVWYRKAAENGSQDGKENRERLMEQ